jgi:hypothetical protein
MMLHGRQNIKLTIRISLASDFVSCLNSVVVKRLTYFNVMKLLPFAVSVRVYSLNFSENTALISMNNDDRLIFIFETECFCCDVGTEFLCVI